MLLLGERMAQEIGSVIALLLSAMIWNENGTNSLLIFSVIWLGGVFLECFVLFIYGGDSAAKSQDALERPLESETESPPPMME